VTAKLSGNAWDFHQEAAIGGLFLLQEAAMAAFAKSWRRD